MTPTYPPHIAALRGRIFATGSVNSDVALDELCELAARAEVRITVTLLGEEWEYTPLRGVWPWKRNSSDWIWPGDAYSILFTTDEVALCLDAMRRYDVTHGRGGE